MLLPYLKREIRARALRTAEFRKSSLLKSMRNELLYSLDAHKNPGKPLAIAIFWQLGEKYRERACIAHHTILGNAYRADVDIFAPEVSRKGVEVKQVFRILPPLGGNGGVFIAEPVNPIFKKGLPYTGKGYLDRIYLASDRVFREEGRHTKEGLMAHEKTHMEFERAIGVYELHNTLSFFPESIPGVSSSRVPDAVMRITERHAYAITARDFPSDFIRNILKISGSQSSNPNQKAAVSYSLDILRQADTDGTIMRGLQKFLGEHAGNWATVPKEAFDSAVSRLAALLEAKRQRLTQIYQSFGFLGESPALLSSLLKSTKMLSEASAGLLEKPSELVQYASAAPLPGFWPREELEKEMLAELARLDQAFRKVNGVVGGLLQGN
ncbi:MAG: hypothetical protein WC861_04285 [Candidatus Micrarchaeia archaeon]|jgi:hypothetical protein